MNAVAKKIRSGRSPSRNRWLPVSRANRLIRSRVTLRCSNSLWDCQNNRSLWSAAWAKERDWGFSTLSRDSRALNTLRVKMALRQYGHR